MLLIATSTIDRSALSRLERHFSLCATFGACDFVHGSAAVSSFFTHSLVTPLFRLVTRKIIPEVESAAYRPLVSLQAYLKLYEALLCARVSREAERVRRLTLFDPKFEPEPRRLHRPHRICPSRSAVLAVKLPRRPSLLWE